VARLELTRGAGAERRPVDARRHRDSTPHLEGRATLELWLGLDAHDETTGTVAPAVALGVRF